MVMRIMINITEAENPPPAVGGGNNSEAEKSFLPHIPVAEAVEQLN